MGDRRVWWKWKWSCTDDRAGRPVIASGKSPNLAAAGQRQVTAFGDRLSPR